MNHEMNASKENARKAQKMLTELQNARQCELTERQQLTRFEQIDAFIDACVRRLPSEAAFEADRQRRKQRASDTQRRKMRASM